MQEYIGGPTDYYNYTVCDDDDPSGAKPPCDDTSTCSEAFAVGAAASNTTQLPPLTVLLPSTGPVSYTHLTLPTIYSV